MRVTREPRPISRSGPASAVAFGVGVGVGVGIGVGVGVGVGVSVGVGSGVGDGVGVGGKVGTGVALGAGVEVASWLGDGRGVVVGWFVGVLGTGVDEFCAAATVGVACSSSSPSDDWQAANRSAAKTTTSPIQTGLIVIVKIVGKPMMKFRLEFGWQLRGVPAVTDLRVPIMHSC